MKILCTFHDLLAPQMLHPSMKLSGNESPAGTFLPDSIIRPEKPSAGHFSIKKRVRLVPHWAQATGDGSPLAKSATPPGRQPSHPPHSPSSSLVQKIGLFPAELPAFSDGAPWVWFYG